MYHFVVFSSRCWFLLLSGRFVCRTTVPSQRLSEFSWLEDTALMKYRSHTSLSRRRWDFQYDFKHFWHLKATFTNLYEHLLWILQVGDSSAGWALGYMLILSNLLPSEKISMRKALSLEVFGILIFLFVLLLPAALLFICLQNLCWKGKERQGIRLAKTSGEPWRLQYLWKYENVNEDQQSWIPLGFRLLKLQKSAAFHQIVEALDWVWIFSFCSWIMIIVYSLSLKGNCIMISILRRISVEMCQERWRQLMIIFFFYLLNVRTGLVK